MPDISGIDESLLSGLSEQERKILFDTLSNLSKGDSGLLNKLKYADFDEIPVDVETFLHDKRYLGNGLIDAENRFTVFPYWEEMLKKLFPDNLETKYNTLILTGAIGLGKSMCAVLCMLYLLYRMLCLKDPYLYYGLQPIDKITFSLINVTIDAAKGVAWDKLQQLVQSSPWFMSHGSMSGRTELIWTPDKRIELVVGSSNNAVIGRAVFCLDGETEILTDKGYKKLNSLIGERIRVISYDDGMLCLSNYCHVNPTGITSEEYQIRLDDGTTLKCTKNHRFLLKNNEYVQASDIRVGDELIGVQPDCLHKVVDCKCVTLNDEKQYYDVIDASPFNNFLVRTNSGMIVSHNCNFTDKEI